MSYVALSLVTIIFDVVEMLIVVVLFAKNDPAFEETIMLVVSFSFITLDFYYFIWVLSLKLKLPEEITTPVQQALVGKVGKLVQYLRSK